MDLNEKQLQILDIAEKLFAENGFDATSVRHIAKEADINVAMISYYFGSKEKLLETLFAHKVADFKLEINQIVHNEDLDWFEKVDRLVSLLVQRIHKNRRVHKIINNEYSSNCRNFDIQKFIDRKKENYILLEKFIKSGQKAGAFTKNVEISLIVPTILGTYFYFYYNKKIFHLMYNLDENSADEFVLTTLNKHVQQTIKAILTYEN
ncbi:transcriptional regulator, TetR family [Pustulibacterium marinum]|uniref:Transcriptional regulator, TetR family n=1 Tax=Pustulibacterium marinum TaxID=1224947 RepID=A0A1I7HQ49_9FLAO|nr:TetR family transcriptional regulator [Pustulibacterium marinum]SFU62791.1 transcriptional regulator, TetR family [Pustulibacterium marinum]